MSSEEFPAKFKHAIESKYTHFDHFLMCDCKHIFDQESHHHRVLRVGVDASPSISKSKCAHKERCALRLFQRFLFGLVNILPFLIAHEDIFRKDAFFLNSRRCNVNFPTENIFRAGCKIKS